MPDPPPEPPTNQPQYWTALGYVGEPPLRAIGAGTSGNDGAVNPAGGGGGLGPVAAQQSGPIYFGHVADGGND